MDASSEVAGMGHNAPPLTDRLAAEFEDILRDVQALADDANKVKAKIDKDGLNSDEDLEPLVEIGKRATKLASAIDSKRLDRTKPLRDDVATINTFFETIKTRATRIKTAFAEKVGAYDDAKRARERREAAVRAERARKEAEDRLKEAAEQKNSVLGDVFMNEAEKAEQEYQMAASAAVSAGQGPTRTGAGTVSATTSYDFTVENWDKLVPAEIWPNFTSAEIEKAIRAHVRKHKDTKPLTGVKIFPTTKTRFS